MYAHSARNDCFEILSAVLTLQAAFLSSGLRVVGYGGIYHKPIFNVIYKKSKNDVIFKLQVYFLVKVSIS